MPQNPNIRSAFSFLIFLFLISTVNAVEESGMRLIKGNKTVNLIEGRGKWSQSENDYRIDLTDKWTAVRSDGEKLGEINIPFFWDDYEGKIDISRTFTLPDSFANYSSRLIVDGFAQYIAITLNGANLDSRRGDNASLQIELNPRLLRYGSDNEIVITLDNRLSLRKNIPLSGSIYAKRRYGGIYSNVYIISTPLIAIADLQAQWSESDTTSDGCIIVNTELRNWSHQIADSSETAYLLKTEMLDPSSNIIISANEANIRFPSSGIINHTSVLTPVNVEKWKLTIPSRLYIIRCSMFCQVLTPDRTKRRLISDRITSHGFQHTVETKIGIRSIELTSQGFSLNGERLSLRCVSYANNQRERGALVDEDRTESDVQKIKELGANAVRIMQGSASMQFLDMCDRYGLLVFEELPVFQAPDPVLSDHELIRSASDQLEAMILRDRQFTCIAGWGIGSQINPPNSNNEAYYKTLTQLAHKLDDRPVYASFPITDEFKADPLDFAILEIIPDCDTEELQLPHVIVGDKPALVGSVRRFVLPGNLGGYVDLASEAGQADYILSLIKQTEQLKGCAGVIIGDFADWEGAVPSISSPLKGTGNLYTTGIFNSSQKPRLAFQHIKEYWTTGRVQPLARGKSPHHDGALIIIVGLALIIFLFLAARRNNIFKLNLSRTFTSSKSFFYDISGRRFFQIGQTILIAVLISGGLALVGTGWLYTNRNSYPLDWLLGYLFGNSETHHRIATMIWQPMYSLSFLWGVLFLFIWLFSIRVVMLFKILGKRCSLSQGIAYVTWSQAGYLIFLPIGMLSKRLFEASYGWLIGILFILITVWSLHRLVVIIVQQTRRSVLVITILWLIGPVIVLTCLFIGLEYTHYISDYWGFFWGTICV
ncbi:MAG: glycoside hydrolase family 2 TIM barrel-domain containing protein [Candidatus Hatepunaea meridiana]|nr:glycoside hydrolase family 2 TIM barrel-domain containing protein [Candidatus Hatepunaea meridiana]